MAQLLPSTIIAPLPEAELIVFDPYAPDLDGLLSADALRVFWAHDHHHSFAHYVMFLLKTNIILPAHFCRRDHLFAFNANIGNTVPATTNQWPVEELEHLARQDESGPRSDDLYGGFGAYDVGLQRSIFVGAVMERLPQHALSIRRIQNCDDPYFSLSSAQRYADWRHHKVSLCAAIGQDIPIRLFDALASGQIPIVPNSLTNLDWVISPQDQTKLGIETYDADDPDSAIAAWRRALGNFDRLSVSGIKDRIFYFLDNHSLVKRLEIMLRTVLRI